MIRNLLIVTGLLGIGLQIYYASHLPAVVASHFGVGGSPNGWMSNHANLLFGSGMIILISGIFLSVPLILRKAPVGLINFPKKSYWLAPARREATIPRIAAWLGCMGIATNLFLLVMNHLVYQANLTMPARLNEPAFLGLLAGYLVTVVAWLIALFVKFNRTA